MQQIDLIPEDDIVSILDRLDWATDPNQVLLVLPDNGRLLTNPVDLARLRRHADTLRLEVGLQTIDPRVTGPAAEVGIPTFRTADQAARDERRWRRSRRRGQHIGLTAKEIDWVHFERREMKQQQALARQHPTTFRAAHFGQIVRQYAVIPLFFLLAALLFIGIAYWIPNGSITLTPFTERLELRQPIIGDPQQTAVNPGAAVIPAAEHTTQASWTAEIATTGLIERPDAPARGQVIFVNNSDQPLTVPAGTRLATTIDPAQWFETVQPIAVPGVSGGTAEADIIAVQPGPDGNVAAEQITFIDGPLVTQIQVRNPEPTSGGGLRPVAAVSDADLERLRAQVVQYLQAQAIRQIEAELGPGQFIARDSVRISRVLSETPSHESGSATATVSLVMTAEVSGLTVDTTLATDIVYNQLIQAIRPGYGLLPQSFVFTTGSAPQLDDQGRVQFEMVGSGLMMADLAPEPLLAQIAGQETAVAAQYLYEQLPLAAPPDIRVVPNWFGRMPYLPSRIEITIETQ